MLADFSCACCSYVMDVYMPRDRMNRAEHRGFGFVTFETEAAIIRVASYSGHMIRYALTAVTCNPVLRLCHHALLVKLISCHATCHGFVLQQISCRHAQGTRLWHFAAASTPALGSPAYSTWLPIKFSFLLHLRPACMGGCFGVLLLCWSKSQSDEQV